ncbi:MAG: hypothetical protein H6832_14630 [Planctomycetes bacterium]|nr:hypothetical protein [Planctomycetota bacterium]
MVLRIIFILAFCLMTIGAAGFDKEIEGMAWPFYLGGLAVTLATGFMLRKRDQADTAASSTHKTSFASLHDAVSKIRNSVTQIERETQNADRTTILAHLDEVLTQCSMLGARNEEYLKALGPDRYVRIWDGFATAERLLARAWSMTADGFPDDAKAEIPRALLALERAVAAE